LGLLLPRAERSAVRACAQAHRDGFPDEPAREEEGLDRLQADAAQSGPSAWDAWDGAHRVEAADALLQLLALLAAGDAGKSADPERAARAQDASFPPELRLARLGLAEPDAVAGLYTPDEARSAGQSCAAQVFAARQQLVERLDAVCSEPRERHATRRRLSMAPQARVEQPPLVAALRGGPVARLLPEPQVVQAAQLERQASQPPAARS
jgi:hypothetical protein